MDKLGIKYGGPVRKKLALLQYSQARHLRDAIYPTSHLNLLRSKSTISYNAENFLSRPIKRNFKSDRSILAIYSFAFFIPLFIVLQDCLEVRL